MGKEGDNFEVTWVGWKGVEDKMPRNCIQVPLEQVIDWQLVRCILKLSVTLPWLAWLWHTLG